MSFNSPQDRSFSFKKSYQKKIPSQTVLILDFLIESCYLTVKVLNGIVILYTNNTPKRFCFSFTGALDLRIHIIFPFTHCPFLLILPPNPITGMMCAFERASFFLKMPFKMTLIVNSNSLTFPLLIFIFKSPPGNCWTLVLLVSPIHSHTCASDLFIKAGVFKAAQRLFIINHSDPPRVLSEMG